MATKLFVASDSMSDPQSVYWTPNSYYTHK